MIVLAHVGDVDDFRDDVAVFAGITPEVFPAWEKLPREQDATDEVFGRAAPRRRAGWPGRCRPGSSSRRSRPCFSRCPGARSSSGCRARSASATRSAVEELAAWLLERGMVRAEVVEVPGRVQPPRRHLRRLPDRRHRPRPRIEFFGDEVESIRPFDAESQRSLDRWDNVTLTHPARFDEQNQASFRSRSPTSSPSGTWVALVEPADLREEGRHYLAGSTTTRGLYTVESTFERLIRYPSIAVSALAADSLEATCHLRIESVERFSGDLAKVKAELDGAAAGDRVLIACHNAGRGRAPGRGLRRHRAGPARAGCTGPSAGSAPGFHLIDARTLVIADHELFARADVRRPVTRRDGTRAGPSTASST